MILCILHISACSRETEGLFLKFLSPAERTKAFSIRDVLKRNIYIQSHAFKRFILSRSLETDPATLDFHTNTYGKPFISKETNSRGLFFNLSHTVGLAAMIVGHVECIGIDVEQMVPRDDIHLLEQVSFHTEELTEAEKITDPLQREQNFFRKWVIKESILKAVGTGFSIDPKWLQITKDETSAFRLKCSFISHADSFTIRYFEYGDYAIAYSINDDNTPSGNLEKAMYNYSNGSFNKIE